MKTNITKQMILAAVITFGLFSAANAQVAYDDQQQYNNDQQYSYSQPQQQYQQPVAAPAPVGQQSFYYYPNANVYYDPSCSRYIYNNGGSWLSVNILPSSIFLGNSPRYMVYHRGPQVWLDNPVHIRNYYRPAIAYRQPIVAYNNNFRHNDFAGREVASRNFDHRDFGRDRGFDHNRGGHR